MKKQTSQTDDLMTIAAPIVERMRDMWWAAFQEQMTASIETVRDAQDRAEVLRAGEVAHKAAVKMYIAVYKRVFKAAMGR